MKNSEEINRLLDLHKETRNLEYFKQAMAMLDKEDITDAIAKEIRGQNEK